MIKKEIIANGASVDEAIVNGCRELEIDRDEAKFEIIELPKSKTLGLFGGSPAVVRVYLESNRAQDAADYLKSIIDAMGLEGVEIEIVMNEDEKGAALNLTGDALGAVIGRRGETLTALQYLVSLAANNGDDEYFRIAINIGNYREKREGSLENLAKKTAQRCLKISRNLALDPMNPYERRIIHTAVQEVEGATSWSVGEGPKRHVVIGPVGVAEGEDGLPVNHSRNSPRGAKPAYGNRGRGSYGGNRGGYSKGGYGGNRGGSGYGNRSGYSKPYNKEGGYSKPYNKEGGYNKPYNKDSGYQNRSGSSRGSGYTGSKPADASREVKKDTSAPLYGRIEVPKKSEPKDE